MVTGPSTISAASLGNRGSDKANVHREDRPTVIFFPRGRNILTSRPFWWITIRCPD
jgi:hypothetical protein